MVRSKVNVDLTLIVFILLPFAYTQTECSITKL